ncbi:hypothetical protein [Nocardia fluminea]|uniref:hypothetical protein n=1 Tax=Nocardia fluminea TaxID=134984 RepID=UPI00340D270E
MSINKLDELLMQENPKIGAYDVLKFSANSRGKLPDNVRGLRTKHPATKWDDRGYVGTAYITQAGVEPVVGMDPVPVMDGAQVVDVEVLPPIQVVEVTDPETGATVWVEV